MRSSVSRRAGRRINRFWGMAFALSLLVFCASLLSAAPVVGQKLESLRYRILESLPAPEHTEFLPTPRPTVTRLALRTTSTLTPQPTDTATTLPTESPTVQPSRTRTVRPTRTPQAALKPIAPSVQLTGVKHDYQRWNNCGPTTLEMALSYFGHLHPQADLAAFLKPDPDDKNVNPTEMAAYVTQDGLNATI
ncbi:MAG: C39 family peptidase, partial [Rudaea sp.]